MDSSGEQRSARMRRLHEDDSLVFPKRPVEPLSLDVDCTRHTRVFSDDVMSGNDIDMCTRTSQTKARFLVIGGFCCFLFLLVTVSIYSSLNEQNNIEAKAMDTDDNELRNEYSDIEEIFDETILDNEDSLPSHVTEGGDVINSMDYDDDLIIPDIEPADDADSISDDRVVAKGDGIADITADGDEADVFIMDINGIRFEIGVGDDGDFDLPEGLILNPHVRQHWALIQSTLGLDYYDDDEEGKMQLEPPVATEEDNIDNEDVGVKPAQVQAVRMPEGLLFDAPSATGEHIHGEGCDPVSVEVEDKMADLSAGDGADISDGDETIDEDTKL